jgi:DNA-binding XRE family transcriptional regulator
VPKSAHRCASPSVHSFQPLQFCLQLFNPLTVRPNPKRSGGAASSSENVLRISIFQKNLVCPKCQLRQYERGSGKCRRCHHNLGISYVEVYLPNSLSSISSQNEIEIRKEVGGLIRRMRSRREITQAGLASLTGIHRTYLSRAERGQVLPSLIALMQIARALEVDKILFGVGGLKCRQRCASFGMCRTRHILGLPRVSWRHCADHDRNKRSINRCFDANEHCETLCARHHYKVCVRSAATPSSSETPGAAGSTDARFTTITHRPLKPHFKVTHNGPKRGGCRGARAQKAIGKVLTMRFERKE